MNKGFSLAMTPIIVLANKAETDDRWCVWVQTSHGDDVIRTGSCGAVSYSRTDRYPDAAPSAAHQE